MRDEHTHHPGNGLSLCLACHDWAHDNPTAAREVGLIVSRHAATPCDMPWEGYYGWVQTDCLSRTHHPL